MLLIINLFSPFTVARNDGVVAVHLLRSMQPHRSNIFFCCYAIVWFDRLYSDFRTHFA